jgi:ferrous iron transport protein A
MTTTRLPRDNAVSLDQCCQGVEYRVHALVAQPRFGAQDEYVSLRLTELGFLPGCRLRVIGYGFLGRDPIAVQINGTKFALRGAEAAKILVEPIAASESVESGA